MNAAKSFVPMNNFTPERTRPKKATLDFVRAFARNYQPEADNETHEEEPETPTLFLQACC